MTDYDRKMIELAATAAGYEIARWTDNNDALLLVGVQEPWNPLADDGDALRLAVKMELVVAAKQSREYVMAGHGSHETIYVTEFTDPEAATRRAIVRAAAEIGRTKAVEAKP